MNTNQEKMVVYCYNYHLGYPNELSEGGTNYVRTHYNNSTEGITKAVYQGYPNGNGKIQGTLTEAEFRGITQYAVWHFIDNLSKSTVKSRMTISGAQASRVEEGMRIFDLLVSGKDNEDNSLVVPTDFKLDFFNAKETDYQNLLGAVKTVTHEIKKTFVEGTIEKIGSDTGGELLKKAALELAMDDSDNETSYFKFASQVCIARYRFDEGIAYRGQRIVFNG